MPSARTVPGLSRLGATGLWYVVCAVVAAVEVVEDSPNRNAWILLSMFMDLLMLRLRLVL